MKAIVYSSYGPPDVLRLEDIPKPTPGDDEVVIQVRASTVNPADWHFMRGTPYLIRLTSGLSKPRITQLGIDVAGEVETVGRNVVQFKPGDHVFGWCRGAFAEFTRIPASAIVTKPANVTFEQVACVPVAAVTALQGLRDKGRIQPGQKVLINGASGGVGTFAVQIAKSFGAEVTGVCSTGNVEMVQSIGADRVIDYTRENFTEGEQRYDLILDNAGNHSLSAVRRVLRPKGRYVQVGGPDKGQWVGPMTAPLKAVVFSRFVSQKFVMFIASGNRDDMTTLSDLMQAGKVTPVIDRRYALSEVADAIRYLEEGHARGKVVITVAHNEEVDIGS
ncbi:MAG: NAD(P)-dependent alcohol dehydrogenase [Gemmatimonadota bacterium]|nr:NAD(P)-dependent alcohol dehydrogenase [Gemmatimonadota bacterium]